MIFKYNNYFITNYSTVCTYFTNIVNNHKPYYHTSPQSHITLISLNS